MLDIKRNKSKHGWKNRFTPTILAKRKIINRDGVKLIVREGTHDELVVNDCLNRFIKKRVDILGAGNKKDIKKDIWLDIGGHIGAFILPLVKWHLAGRAYSFEPDPLNFALLKENVLLNDMCTSVKIFSDAVTSHAGSRLLYYSSDGRTSASSFLVKGGRVPVRVTTVDINSLLKRWKIDFIKMDCEGAEVEIVNSVEDWCSVRGIYIEYHFSALDRKYLGTVQALERCFSFMDRLKKHFKTVIGPKKNTGAWFTDIYALDRK